MLPYENPGWESLVKALAQFYFCCSGARADTMNDTNSKRLETQGQQNAHGPSDSS